MAQNIKVSLFGQFRIQTGDKQLDSVSMRSNQLVKLLAYLLIYRNKNITLEEFVETLWEDGVDNPAGALKNLIYRLRNALKTLGDEKYILTMKGSYCWNDKIPVELDSEVFEEKCRKAQKFTGSLEEKISLYEEALGYYQGNFLAEFFMESWMIALSTFYRSLYLTMTKELARLYNKNHCFEKLEQLTIKALEQDNLDEELHYWAIKGLIGQNKLNLALEHYDEACKLLYKNLGIHQSEYLGQVYQELLSLQNVKDLSLEDICKDIDEKEELGAFFCEYGTFKEIYRLEARRIARLGTSEYLLLLTIKVMWDQEQGKKKMENYKKCIEEVLNRSLRMGDVVANYSMLQYVVLLQACSYETGTLVAERIVQRFKEKCPDPQVCLFYQLKEMEAKSPYSC